MSEQPHWNRPNNADGAQDGKRGASAYANRKGRPFARGLLAALIVIVGGGLAAYFILGRSEAPAPVAPTEKSRSAIAEAQPAKPSSKVAPTPAPKPEKPVRRSRKGTPIPDNVQPDERGVLRYPGGLRWVDTNDIHLVKHPQKRQLFTHACDNQIATLLTLDPTRMAPFLVGKRRPYGPQFVEDFKTSLAALPEAHDENDTPEEAELRKAVIETKADLKARMDAGEDIAQIMNDTQKELDRLCQYHNDLKQELKKIERDETFSDEDVRDYVEAANKLLEKQGIAGFTMPSLLHRQVRLQLMRERREREASGAN